MKSFFLSAQASQISTINQGPAANHTSTTNVTPQLYGALAPTEEYTASVQSVSSSTAGTTVAVTNGGLTFNLTFDAGAPASFMAVIEQAALMLSAAIADKITVNLNIHYTGTGGGAFAGPSTGLYENYSTIRSDLITQASPGDTTFNALPNTSSIAGQSLVAVWNTQLKGLGLISPTNSATDGSATFATDIDPSLLVGVALHELTHALGRVPYGSAPDIFDLFRFTSPGVQLFTGGSTAVASYFSVDGGNTDLADYRPAFRSQRFSQPRTDVSRRSLQQPHARRPFQRTLWCRHSAEPHGRRQEAARRTRFPPNQSQRHLPHCDLSPSSAGRRRRWIAQRLACHHRCGERDSVGRDDQDFRGRRQRFFGRQALCQWRPERHGRGGRVTVSWNATTDTLTLTGSASIATYETLLSEITFQDTGTDTSNGSHPTRTVTWSINDGTHSYSATSMIGIDRAPIVTSSVGTDIVGTTLSTTTNGVLANASDLDGDS